MKENPVRNAARGAKQKRRVGETAACALCGFAEPEALQRVLKPKLNREARRVIEHHHVVGRAHDPSLTVPLCLNCHAKATEQVRCVGGSMRPAETFLERLVAVLRALGAFLAELGKRLLGWASKLAAFVEALDAKYPPWRAMPEAS